MKKQFFSYAAAMALFVLLVLYSAPARTGAVQGLELWSGLLVPSLLPYFAAAGLLTRLGFIDAVGRRLSGTGARLFGVSGTGCGIFLLGLSGGYPLGAAAVADAVRAGTLDRQEAERLLGFCDNTGPAFAVGALGAGVFRSAGWGLFLWGIHALTAVLLGLAGRRAGQADAAAPPPARGKALSFPDALTAAVAAAVSALIGIGGYVVFFSALLGVTDALGFPHRAAEALAGLSGGDPAFFRAMFTGALELSSGIGDMAALPLTPASLALGAFLLGWGGLCVHLQAVSVTADAGLSLGGRLRGKLCHGLLSAALAFCLASLLL